ncbi:Uncharacterised protein [Vibrio cholerae]|nr:Uncharacterised protein [Vibrio cholerae]CSA06543.1 Uncharacterised protein [Vibrio cholerae]CSA08202.1 Uncharacterised protein [Vibrio cholerae]CSB29735.1 Uncharacterised protein [Vibrio cholerae]CSB77601.1 Uncharacterised protein [Vibrio cholerae]
MPCGVVIRGNFMKAHAQIKGWANPFQCVDGAAF